MERDSPARPARQHEHNLALVMRLAARMGPVSRARLAEHSGLTKTTITQLTGELLDGGLLREVSPGRATGPGRPATPLVLNALGPSAIGLQVEHDHVAACHADLTGRVRERALRRVDDHRDDPHRVLKVAEPLLRRLLHAADSAGTVVARVAVGVPGRTTSEGMVRSTGLGWPETPLVRLLEERIAALSGGAIPVTVHSAYQLAALAEAWFGPGVDGGLLYVGGEAGIGAGFVADGAAGGGRCWAGELGHVRVRRGGPECVCGGRGCLDTVAGPQAWRRAAGVDGPVPSRLVSGRAPLPGWDDSDDRAVTSVARGAARALGGVLAGVVELLDPTLVVVGGCFGRLGPSFAGLLESALAEAVPGLAVPVRSSRLGGDAVARAAAATVVRELIDDPCRWLAR